MRTGACSRYGSPVSTSTLAVASAQKVDDFRHHEDHQGVARPADDRAGALVVVVPAALMLCLGLLGLDRHSVWRDEAASLVAARRSLPELWTMVGHVDIVHALYYALLHVWLQVGSGEAWARVPSVLAMAAAAGLVGLVGARLVSPSVGLVAGLLFAVNPSVSYYAQEARSTALVVAVALLATWLLLQAVDRSPRWWAAYAAACVVLVALNLLAILVPLGLALTLLWWGGSRRVLLRCAVATATTVPVAVALLVISSRQPFQIGWIPRPGLGSVRDFAHLSLGPTLPLVVIVGLLLLAGILPTRVPAEHRLQALALPLMVLPTSALVVVSLVQPVFVPRYVFPSVAAVSLLAGLGVVRLGRAAARLTSRSARSATTLVAAVAVLVVAVAGVGAQRLERTPASRPDDLAAAAAIIAAGARPGDAVVFLPDDRRLLELVYPGSFEGVRDVALAASPEAVGNLAGRPLPLPTTLDNLSASPRVWAVGRPGLALLASETNARAELGLLDRTFVPVERAGSHGVGITLYVKQRASS